MRTLGRDRLETSFVIEEAKNMTRLLGEWNMSQVKREGNEVANALASLASRSKLSEAQGGRGQHLHVSAIPSLPIL
jgi:hypothetical protein